MQSGVSINELRDAPAFIHRPYTMFKPLIPISARNDILAKAIPALSGSVGSRAVLLDGNVENIDLNATGNTEMFPAGWPRTAGAGAGKWLHSDLNDVAYLYNHKVFEDIVEKGNLK